MRERDFKGDAAKTVHFVIHYSWREASGVLQSHKPCASIARRAPEESCRQLLSTSASAASPAGSFALSQLFPLDVSFIDLSDVVQRSWPKKWGRKHIQGLSGGRKCGGKSKVKGKDFEVRARL
uniref:Uncharacterized protein n=1 Tax=Knipowitschia caucasica TaxID=637954 RepID=A0AAV2JRK0_KNICA